MEQNFKTHISGSRRLFDLHIRETWQYRDLILLLVKKDFTAQYKQTVLGPLWAILQPLLTTVVFTVVFGNLAGLTKADVPLSPRIPAFLFYMGGNILWGYFASTLKAAANTFLANRSTMGKVYYPRLAAPLASAFSGLISLGIQLALFAGIWLYYVLLGDGAIRVTPRLFLLPLLVLQIMVLSVGTGIIISSVTTKYRDLAMLVDFGLELLKYACPIAYGLTLVPDRWLGLYLLNPFAVIVTAFRRAVFGFGFFDPVFYALSWALCAVLFLAGLMLFSGIERSFMDTI